MVLEAPERIKLPVPVEEDAHWRVVIRPTRFVAERIATRAECERVLAASSVQLRGWDFPHMDGAALTRGSDWIEGSVEFQNIVEYWRFYQSGQFLHLSAFEENRDPRYASGGSELARRRAPADFVPTGSIDFLSIVYATTEIFELASRLAVHGVLGSEVIVEVEMVRIEGRMLTSLSRHLTGPYMASAPRLGHSWTLEAPALIANSASVAVDAAVWFCEGFSWDVSREIIQREQQLLLERR